MWVKHVLKITIFIDGMFTIPKWVVYDIVLPPFVLYLGKFLLSPMNSSPPGRAWRSTTRASSLGRAPCCGINGTMSPKKGMEKRYSM